MATALLGLALGSSLLRLVFDAARVNDFGGILALLGVTPGIVLIMRDMKIFTAGGLNIQQVS